MDHSDMDHSHGHEAHMDHDSVNCTHMEHHSSMSTGDHGAMHHGMMVGIVVFDSMSLITVPLFINLYLLKFVVVKIFFIILNMVHV